MIERNDRNDRNVLDLPCGGISHRNRSQSQVFFDFKEKF